ncbi:hypothetical protein C8R46DRAFT_1356517 [Mycena filopes]|nr:hypothetical protein C8R46DRAFT_1356517 [Mycena filopes]
MSDQAHPQTLDDASQASLHDNAEATPRLSSATPAKNLDGDAEDVQRSGYLAQASAYMPQAVTGWFGGKPPSTPASRSSAAGADDEDETRSTTTDLTELSTIAQAGSDTSSSSPPSPAPTDPTPAEAPQNMESSAAGVGVDDDRAEPHNDEETEHEEGEREKADAEASPFLHEEHAEAKPGVAPKINLAPRTHPLAGGDAMHGGELLREERQAEMDEERAEGVRAPAYDDAAKTPKGEQEDGEGEGQGDSYSSDEARDEVNGGKMKSLRKRVRGQAKVISGKIRRDPARVEEGRGLINEAK